MSIDYLEDLASKIDAGHVYFACQGGNSNEWYVMTSLEDLKAKAQRAANNLRFEVNIYRLVNKMETGSDDSYLVVRKILEPGPRGEPHLNWIIVGTREAADMLRDVSEGPSPYFGAVVELTFKPNSQTNTF